jgi:hypothetical protein
MKLPKIVGERTYSDVSSALELIGLFNDLEISKWSDFKQIVRIYLATLN